MTETLTELDKQTGEYLYNNEGWTNEFDKSINDISRAKIEAALTEWGQVWLGNIKLYDEARKQPYQLVRWYGEKVYNFGYDFIIPVNDSLLVELIDNRDKSEYTTSANDFKMIEAIFARIEELKGVHLIWA